jgi:hypothetical protein
MKRDSMLTEEAQNTDFGFAMAYWISPYNQVMAVNNFHINHIFDNPEKYDMTRQELEDVYSKYDEKIPGEGKAREEIIKSLLKRGWIRIRKYRIKSGEYWSITIDRLTNRINDSITDWCNQMVTRLKANINDEIKIRSVGEGTSDFIDIDMDGVMKLHLFRYLQESKAKKVSSYKDYIKKCLTEELPSASAPRLNKLIEKNEKETEKNMKKSLTELIIELVGDDEVKTSKHKSISPQSFMEAVKMNGFSINKSNDVNANIHYFKFDEDEETINEDYSIDFFSDKGGIITFSTDVNAIKTSTNKLINYIKNKIKTIYNRLTANKKMNKVLLKHESIYGVTIGNFVRGRYKAEDGTLYDEKSLSIEIIGITPEVLNLVAEDLAREFSQESVLVKNYETNKIYLVQIEKSATQT